MGGGSSAEVGDGWRRGGRRGGVEGGREQFAVGLVEEMGEGRSKEGACELRNDVGGQLDRRTRDGSSRRGRGRRGNENNAWALLAKSGSPS